MNLVCILMSIKNLWGEKIMSKWTKLRDQAREYANDAGKKIEKEFNLKENFEQIKKDSDSFFGALKNDTKKAGEKISKSFKEAVHDLNEYLNGNSSEMRLDDIEKMKLLVNEISAVSINDVALEAAEKADREFNDTKIVSLEAGRIFTEEMESIGLISNDDSE